MYTAYIMHFCLILFCFLVILNCTFSTSINKKLSPEIPESTQSFLDTDKEIENEQLSIEDHKKDMLNTFNENDSQNVKRRNTLDLNVSSDSDTDFLVDDYEDSDLSDNYIDALIDDYDNSNSSISDIDTLIDSYDDSNSSDSDKVAFKDDCGNSDSYYEDLPNNEFVSLDLIFNGLVKIVKKKMEKLKTKFQEIKNDNDTISIDKAVCAMKEIGIFDKRIDHIIENTTKNEDGTIKCDDILHFFSTKLKLM
ncbi:MATH and LRR domain-containing protein PFE0570w-like isoform X2 [Daktulosphaira vitifoliae]|uniref:MATH and LRR domain-containing protein PFE0570w-like isoform X2 n=1 Tax=Daktulosphaira vitifoliae TaxID=58002 RepID=UPI0021AA5803|nr:MATH and LRR domain-containing protein PFE0570w-like isoform X2 [Daktulosphaira vitifoliae]